MITYENFPSLFSDELNITEVLRKNGYHSVFDIVRQSKTDFIRNLYSESINRETSSAIYDTASGLAIQLCRQFLASKHQTSERSLTSPGGLMKNGPTWQNLFQEDWSSYCLNDSPEANDSPVSYLAWIYNQALEFETQMNSKDIIPLSERRPDLANLFIDDAAINEVIPALQLVNEILEDAIEPYVAANGTDSVNQTLAVTRYPNSLPYHFPHQQTFLSLKNSELNFNEVIKKSDPRWPFFTHNTSSCSTYEMAMLLGSDLAPGQLNIIIEPDNTLAEDLSSFYLDNFGVVTTDYQPFNNSDVLCRAINTTSTQLENMLAMEPSGTTVSASENCYTAEASSGNYGASYINGDSSSAIEFTREDSLSGFETDVQSSPIAMVVNSNSKSVIDGMFTTALTVDATQKDEVYLPYDFSSDGSNSIDFTFTFWCCVHSGVKDLALITTNKMSSYPESGKGISLFCKLQGDVPSFYLEASDGTNTPSKNDQYFSFPVDTWIFVAIRQDVANKKIYGSYCTDGVTIQKSVVDLQGLGSIALSSALWGLNGDKSNSYYANYPERESLISYDDITVWDRMLEDDEIAGFVNNHKPAGGYSGMKHYYPLDGEFIPANTLMNLSDERMDRINRQVRLQRWMALPYDQVDLLLSRVSTGAQIYGKPARSEDGSYGSAVLMDSAKRQYAVIKDDFSSAGESRASFTMGFWVNIHSTPVGDVMLCGNTVISSDGESKDRGFFLLGSSKQFFLSICDDNRNYASNKISYEYDEWNYYIFSVDWDNEVINICKRTRGSNKENITGTMSLKNINGHVPVTSDWFFNNHLMGNYYEAFSRQASVEFDGVSIWNKALTADELASVASSTQPSGGRTDMSAFYDFSANQMNSNTLRMQGVFRQYADKFNVSAFQFATLMGGITPYAISPEVSFFDQIFNSPSLFDTPFAITNKKFSYSAPDADDLRIIRQICAGLNINEQQFYVLADIVAAQQGDNKGKILCCSLDMVSAFYRVVMLPRWMGYSFNDGMALLSLNEDALSQLAAIPLMSSLDANGQPVQKDILDVLMNLSDADEWSKTYSLLPSTVYTWLMTSDLQFPGTTSELNFIKQINQQLPATLLNENVFLALPIPEPTVTDENTFISWMTTLDDVIDANGLVKNIVMENTTDYDAIYNTVISDISGWTFGALTNEEVASVLTDVIWQARQAQYGIGDNAIATALNITLPLAPILLNWCASTEYDFLNDTLALKECSQPDQIPTDYLQQLYELARRAGICNHFNLSPVVVETFLNDPDWFSVADTAITFNLIYQLSRYSSWLALAGKEEAVLAYLRWANALVLPDGETTYAQSDIEKAAKLLSLLVDWDSSEVQNAVTWINDEGVAQEVSQIDSVLRFKDMCMSANVSVRAIIDVGELTINSTWSDWANVGDQLIAAQSSF